MQPSRLLGGEGGTISTSGRPNRVIRIGWRVLFAHSLKNRGAFGSELRNADFLHSSNIVTTKSRQRKVTKAQSGNNEDTYRRAMRQALARKPLLKTDWPVSSREEAHDRGCLRG
jgi:hypothetical protein